MNKHQWSHEIDVMSHKSVDLKVRTSRACASLVASTTALPNRSESAPKSESIMMILNIGAVLQIHEDAVFTEYAKYLT